MTGDERAADEAAVRRWFDRWIEASTEGDLALAMSLIADDAVFLVPGVGEMDKESFAVAMTADDPSRDFDLDCAIREVRILGEHAWLWIQISLAITDKRTASRSEMAGHALTVLGRQGEGWVVVRDVNTVVEVG